MNREDMLQFLKNEAKGIAAMLGPNCETIVHDMTRPGHPILGRSALPPTFSETSEITIPRCTATGIT